MKLKLKVTTEKELKAISAMELQNHAKSFLDRTDYECHKQQFKKQNTIYLSIYIDSTTLAGYLILVKEEETNSVVLHRIVIDEHCRGIGQKAIIELEKYGKNRLGVRRICLDVYEDNVVGIYIYEKLGYKKYNERIRNNRKILFYEKIIFKESP